MTKIIPLSEKITCVPEYQFDGEKIIHKGHTMFLEDVVKELNNLVNKNKKFSKSLKALLEDLKKEYCLNPIHYFDCECKSCIKLDETFKQHLGELI